MIYIKSILLSKFHSIFTDKKDITSRRNRQSSSNALCDIIPVGIYPLIISIRSSLCFCVFIYIILPPININPVMQWNSRSLQPNQFSLSKCSVLLSLSLVQFMNSRFHRSPIHLSPGNYECYPKFHQWVLERVEQSKEHDIQDWVGRGWEWKEHCRKYFDTHKMSTKRQL